MLTKFFGSVVSDFIIHIHISYLFNNSGEVSLEDCLDHDIMYSDIFGKLYIVA